LTTFYAHPHSALSTDVEYHVMDLAMSICDCKIHSVLILINYAEAVTTDSRIRNDNSIASVCEMGSVKSRGKKHYTSGRQMIR